MRKITGDCYNQIIVKDSGSVIADSSSVTNRQNYPCIFRVLSSWYNTREEMLRLLNATMSGPSTTVGTDLNLNKHLWLQGGVRVTQTIRNPNNYPIHVTIYKCSLKCPEVGATDGVYVEGTLPFAVGSGLSGVNLPTNVFWDFFDQSMRQRTDVAADTSYMKVTGDYQLAGNSTGGYSSNPAIPGNYWERAFGNPDGADFRENMPLSWIFPNIKRKLRIRTVFNGWISALSSRTYSYSASCPSELRPRDYITNDTPNYSKHSYFLMARAYADRVMSVVQCGADQDDEQTAGLLQDRALTQVPSPWSRPPPNFILSEVRTFRLRRGGDSVPSFGACVATSAPPAGGAGVAGGWLGGNYGLYNFGTRQGDATVWAFSTNIAASVPLALAPCVPAFRQHALLENGGRPAGSVTGQIVQGYNAS